MGRKVAAPKSLTRNFSIERDVGTDEIFRFHGTSRGRWEPKRFSGDVVLRSSVAVVQISETGSISSAILEIDPELRPMARSSSIAVREKVGEAIIYRAVDDYFSSGLPYSEAAYNSFIWLVEHPEEMSRLRQIGVEAI